MVFSQKLRLMDPHPSAPGCSVEWECVVLWRLHQEGDTVVWCICDIPNRSDRSGTTGNKRLENGDNYNDPIMIQGYPRTLLGGGTPLENHTQKYMTHATEFVLELSQSEERWSVVESQGLNHVSSHCGPSIPKLSTFSYWTCYWTDVEQKQGNFSCFVGGPFCPSCRWHQWFKMFKVQCEGRSFSGQGLKYPIPARVWNPFCIRLT